MMTVPPLHAARTIDWLRLHLYRGASDPHLLAAVGSPPMTLDEIDAAVRAKWDEQVVALCKARLAMGHVRYESTGSSIFMDLCASISARLTEYRQTGNREHLIDIINLAMLEWGYAPPGTYWEAQDCGGHWSLRNQSTSTVSPRTEE